MKKFTLLIAFLLSVIGSYGQASIYSFAQSNGTYVPITGGTVVTTSTAGTPNLDSYASPQQSLPMAFNFAGVTYNNFYVTSNGQLAFGTTAPSAFTYTALSSSIGGNVILAPLSADLEEGAAGVADIRYEMVGDEIIVQWTNFRRYAKTESFNFQIRLNVVSGEIKFVYDGTPPYAASPDYQPQVGIKSAVGAYSAITVAAGVSWNTPTVITTDVTSSSRAILNGNDGFTTGLTYTWTPPPACSDTPVAGTVSGSLTRNVCAGSTTAVITVTGANAPVPGIVYQWEQSLNGTDWADVTTGSGATTTSFTPPVFDGTTIQYRLKVTCTNTSESVYADVVTVDNQTAPATQVSAVTVAPENTFPTSFAMSWTNGNGNRRMVIVSDAAITDPADASGVAALSANTMYSGTGQQIIYDGTGTATTVYGLNCDTDYFVKVYEYNRCGTADEYSFYYNVTGGTNALTVTTDELDPVSLPISNNFSGFTGTNLVTAVPGWYEANIPTAGGTAPSASYPGGIASNWANSTALGGTTARVNLFTDNRNDWIISPPMEITADTRLIFDAAITNYLSGAADAEGMQGTDDEVNVLVSTDGCGAEWTSIYTFNAANTATLTNVLTEYEILLTDYIGETIQIAFQATDGPVNDVPDYDFHIGNILIEEVPECETPSLLATTAITKNSATIAWEAPEEGTPTGYEYVVSDVSTTPTGNGTASTEITVDVPGLTPSTEYFVFVRSNCGGVYSEWTAAGTFITLCDYPNLLTTTGGSVCGQGEAELAATSSAGQLYWYDAVEDGNLLFTGADFQTPLITETTSYYVSTAQSSPGSDVTVGAGAETSSTYSNPFYSLWSNNHTQHLITAAELQNAGLSAGEINSVALYVTSAGSLPMIDLSVKIGATNAESMEAFADNSSFSTVYTNASLMPVVGVNTLNFSTPFNWDGTSNIILEFCHGNAASSATMSRTVRTDATSYVSSVKYHFSSATGASTVCGTTSGTGGLASYSVRPQFIFNGVGLCFSPREEVVATVTDAPEITVSDAIAICEGEDAEISVSSDNEDYTYNWMPGNLDGATQTVMPDATTTYTVTATDAVSGCVTVSEVTVTVNALPDPVVVSPDPAVVCEGGTEMLTAAGAIAEGDAVMGTGTTAPGSTSWPNPFSAWYGGVKTQILFKASELTAQGLIVGSDINSISFDFFASVANACNDLTIRIGDASITEFTSDGFVSSAGFITVYNDTFTPVAGATGLVPFEFTTPYLWDGGDIIIEVVHNQGNSGNGAGTRTTTTATSYNSVYYGAKDNVTPAGVASLDALATADFSSKNTSTLRPNVVFNYSIENEVIWSPVTELYTDADATIAYNGENTATVYVKPTMAHTYTVTVTNVAGCSVSGTVDVTVNNTPAPAVENADVALCTAATIADLEATGEDIQWYADETGGEALADNTELADGTYYASQTVNGCESTERTEVTVTITVVEAPVAAAEQNFCDAGTIADIEVEGDMVVWYNAATEGTVLAEDTVLEDGMVYYAEASLGDCVSERTAVTVTISNITADAPEDVTACSGYVLPELTNGNYYTGADGTGTMLEAGATVTETAVLYVYAESGTIPNCTAENSFTVTINTVEAPEGEVTQVITANTAEEATIEDIVVETIEGADVMWYANEADVEAGPALPAGTVLVSGQTYYVTQTVGDCTSEPLAITVDVVLGKEDFDIASFSYYPNPVNDVLNISYSSDITSVTVYNMVGQKVITLQPNSSEVKVDMTTLSDGIYTVNVASGNAVKTIRVIRK